MSFELFTLGAIGASGAAIDEIKTQREIKRMNKIIAMTRIDKDLEDKLWHDVCDPDKYEEIWTRIEKYKREHPDVVLKETTSYWGHVGKHRFRSFYAPGERHSKKRDEELLLSKRMTLDLLALTYGGRSFSQASKVAIKTVKGV